MVPVDSAAILVARFLRSNDYTQTLAAFLKETGLPIDAGTTSPGSLTIERVLEEKKTFDLSLNFEKLGVQDQVKKWTSLAPSAPTVINLPTSTNLLCTSLENLPIDGADGARPFILATTADRRLNVIRLEPHSFDVVHSYTQMQDSPILSYTVIAQRYLVCTSMSGKIVVFDVKENEVVAQRKDHAKYVIQVSSYEVGDGRIWIATAGWDGKVVLYLVHLSDTDIFGLGEPVGSIKLAANPEALHFVRHPDDDDLFLLLTRRDSSFLFYYKIHEDQFAEPNSEPSPILLSGDQNLAPYSNAWVAFTPAAIAVCPTDPSLIAVATSTVPHMKLLIVRLLFPKNKDKNTSTPEDSEAPLPLVSPTDLSNGANASTPAARQARVALALQDREAAAITIHCNTMAPQTQYSSPALAWRPDGTGVWVNSDDGVVRGIEAISGKVTTTLVGHLPGSKIRCIWAGYKTAEKSLGKPEELLVSGGFDQQLIIWQVKQ